MTSPTGSAEPGGVPLREFPLVYLSYDEPWAEASFDTLKSLRPDAIHVHGVEGLNACHVAAADATDAAGTGSSEPAGVAPVIG